MTVQKENFQNIYINKSETQQHQFLAKYPEFDGRGLKIAIIDGGMDVSSPGLQKTSTGLPKIIDCFDFTGDGMVDTSTIVKKLDENNSLIGLSGRQLKIPMKWKNPSGEWRLGMKSLVELCYDRFINEESSMQKQNATIPNKEILETPKNDEIVCGEKKVNQEEKQHDPEKFIDCIVWNDGDRWCACLTTGYNFNDLENAKVITNFRDCFEYCFLIDKITCCITIRDDGNQLQICTSTASHATMVSHVAASHFPDNEQNDGMAPGAQIYFMEVLRGTEIILAYEKPLEKCLELGVDLVNISLKYTWTEMDAERLQLLDEMQSKHGTIIVESAGNDGPLFSTMNETSTDKILFIGSLQTSEMYEKVFRCKRSIPPSTIFYSSKGPSSISYSRGISFVAPGLAVIPGSQWISKNPQIAHGTSFAAPSVTGSIACLISALKANSIPYTPAMIKFALSNTAIPLASEDKLVSGNGIIQIDAAFEFLKNFSKIVPRIFLEISIKESKMKGIYLIVTEKDQTHTHCISVKHFENQIAEHIPWILKLLPDKNHSYIKHFKISKNGNFDIQISTNSLVRGKLHYSEIHGFHPSHSEAGSFFHLPITIIAPKISNCFKTKMKIQTDFYSYFYLRPNFKATKFSFKFIHLKEENNICFQKDVIEKDAGKRNDIGNFEFRHEYCNILIQWRNDLFQICFFKWEYVDEVKLCKFEAKFK